MQVSLVLGVEHVDAIRKLLTSMPDQCFNLRTRHAVAALVDSLDRACYVRTPTPTPEPIPSAEP